MKCGLVIVSLALAVTGSATGQVNLPEGFEIVEFGVSERSTADVAINNCAQIVYRKGRSDDIAVYLYDSGAITELAAGGEGRFVAYTNINEAGTIVWGQGEVNVPGSSEVVMLREGRITVVGPGKTPDINDNDLVVVSQFKRYTCHPERDIVLYEGKRPTRITDNRFDEQSPRLNDLDDIVWDRSDGCVVPWVGAIPLYRDGREIVLPSKSEQVARPSINNAGQVVWHAYELGIEMWEAGETIRLIEDGGTPMINNLGDVWFRRFHEENNRSWDAWLYRVSDGDPTFHRLTEDEISDGVGDMNDWGEAVWDWSGTPRGGDFSGGIRFLRRIRTGDAQFDGDIDLTDYAALAECLTGPGRVDRLCDCRFLDIDHDGDVDLGDFARFQNGFVGE